MYLCKFILHAPPAHGVNVSSYIAVQMFLFNRKLTRAISTLLVEVDFANINSYFDGSHVWQCTCLRASQYTMHSRRIVSSHFLSSNQQLMPRLSTSASKQCHREYFSQCTDDVSGAL